MFIGSLLVSSASSDVVVFTPWFPRSADNAVFSYEIIFNDTGKTLSVTTYHKDSEDAGSSPASPATSTFSQLGSTSIYEAKPTGLKEMIRFKITLPATASGSDPSSVIFRFLNPTWYATART